MLGRQTPRLAGTRPAATAGPDIDLSTDHPPDLAISRDHNRVRPASTPSPAGGAVSLAAIYARVSSDTQEKDQTIASQLAALRQAAQERGYQVPPEWEFVDDGHSGARLDRPGLERLRDLAAEGAFAAALVYAPDRLARNYAYQVVVLDELMRAGCDVIFLNHAFGQNPEEQMLLQIQGVFAEYERALITERTRRGRLFAARQGRVNWGGNPPYGYRYLRKTERTPPQLIVEEREAAVVQQLYRWLVEEQLSSYAIQHRLIVERVPTRGTNAQGWAQSSVIKILRNPLYKGEAWYNRSQPADARRPRMQTGLKDLRPGNRRSRTLRPSTEWIPVRVPTVIDPELWQMAQEQLAANRARSTRHNTKHQYLLRGLLVCGRCGRRLIGTWTAISQGRYVCSARYPRSATWSCDGRSVSAALVEHQVWTYMQEVLSEPELLRARYEESRGDPAVEGREERERERIERQVHAMEHEVQRLIDAYQAGAIELHELQERRRRSAEHQHMLRHRLEELQQQRRERAHELRLLQGLEGFCASIRSALTEPSFTVKQKVLQLVVDRIIVEDTQLVIRHVVPTRPVRLQPRHHAANSRRIQIR
jgi:site-specific DNA recombinase